MPESFCFLIRAALDFESTTACWAAAMASGVTEPIGESSVRVR